MIDYIYNGFSLFSPNIAYASFDSFLMNVNSQIINPLITFLFALAVIYFLYGVFEFIRGQNSEDSKTTGRSHMIWGVIGITIMLSVWAIMNIILNTFNIKDINIQIDGGDGEVKVDLNEYNPPR